MIGDSRREHRRALLRDDPGEAERAARLLDRLGTEKGVDLYEVQVIFTQFVAR